MRYSASIPCPSSTDRPCMSELKSDSTDTGDFDTSHMARERHDKAWQGVERHGKAWQGHGKGKTWQGIARRVKTWQGHGKA